MMDVYQQIFQKTNRHGAPVNFIISSGDNRHDIINTFYDLPFGKC